MAIDTICFLSRICKQWSSFLGGGPNVAKPIPRCADCVCAFHTSRGAAAGKNPADRLCVRTGDSSNPGPYVAALRQGLRDLGYIDGKNIVIEYRGAEGKLERIPGIVAELVQLKVRPRIGGVASS